jgi:hypothetical protein
MSGILQGLIGSGRGRLVLTLSGTQTNYDVYDAAVAANASTALPLKIVLEITGTVGGVSGSLGTFGAGAYYMQNTDSGSPYYSTLYASGRWGLKGAVAIYISNEFHPSTKFEINVASGGAVYGGAGTGGISGTIFGSPSYRYGGEGGDAIQVAGAYEVAIVNAGNIWGAGGGGAGAPVDEYPDARRYGGIGYGYESRIASSVGNGPLPAFGGSGTGGYGGDWGTAGGNNSGGNSYGGAAGKAINNSGGATISLTNTGSIIGATS